MGFFNKNSKPTAPVVHPAEQYFVRNELTELKQRLDSDEQLITTRLAELESATGSLADDRAALRDALDVVDSFRQQLTEQRDETGRITTTVASYVNEQFEHLSAAVQSLDARLATLDGTVNSLAADRLQLHQMVASVDEFQRHITDLQQRVGRPDPATAQLRDHVVAATEGLHNELQETNGELERLAEDFASVRERVDALSEKQRNLPPPRLNGGLTPFPPPLNVELGGTGVSAERVDELGDRIERLIAESDGASRQTAQQLAAIDGRVTNISAAIAARLDELSRDIAALAQQPHAGSNGHGAVSAELIQALTERQVQLANEQARYEIAFRRDLAALAEDVHRSKMNN